MKFSVDRIEGDKVILENIENGEKKDEDLLNLPVVKEGDILVLEDNLYRIDDIERENRVKIIREKLEKLRNKN